MSDQFVTFVNIFDVEPERQQELVKLLTRGVDEVIRHRPGFVSLTLLVSSDGRRVLNLAQWASGNDVRAVQADPKAADYAAQTAAIATSTPGVYAIALEIR